MFGCWLWEPKALEFVGALSFTLDANEHCSLAVTADAWGVVLKYVSSVTGLSGRFLCSMPESISGDVPGEEEVVSFVGLMMLIQVEVAECSRYRMDIRGPKPSVFVAWYSYHTSRKYPRSLCSRPDRLCGRFGKFWREKHSL